jgi:phosphohistidine phosphatase
MELFIIRHAEAIPRDPQIEDATRALTPRGKKRWRRAVRALARLNVSFDRVYTSPWTRAAETADALRPLAHEVIVSPRLTEPPSPALLSELEGERVAIVGHEPWCSDLTAWLVCDARERSEGFVLKKGGLARLEGELGPGRMALGLLLTPKILSDLGRR